MHCKVMCSVVSMATQRASASVVPGSPPSQSTLVLMPSAEIQLALALRQQLTLGTLQWWYLGPVGSYLVATRYLQIGLVWPAACSLLAASNAGRSASRQGLDVRRPNGLMSHQPTAPASRGKAAGEAAAAAWPMQ